MYNLGDPGSEFENFYREVFTILLAAPTQCMLRQEAADKLFASKPLKDSL